MDLLPGERVLDRWDDAVTLTNRRIRLQRNAGATIDTVSITLDAISSCEVSTVNPWWMLLVAFLGIALGLAKEQDGRAFLYIGFAVGAFFIVAYLLSRAEFLKIASAGGVISRRTSGRSPAELLRFIDLVEAGKLAVLDSRGYSGERMAEPSGDIPGIAADHGSGHSSPDGQGAQSRVCTACEAPVGQEESLCPSCGNAGTMEA